jgi:hypothetical protein
MSHCVGICVAGAGVRVRVAYIRWHNGAHKGIVPLQHRIARCLWGCTARQRETRRIAGLTA